MAKCIFCGAALRGNKRRCVPRDPFFRRNHALHIGSHAWSAIKASLFAVRGKVCERCGDDDRIEVHHVNYCRLGAELQSDLLVLCARCHNREHILAHKARHTA